MLHLLELLRELIHRINRIHQMLIPELLALTQGKRMRSPHRILDLPAIHAPLR